jgi:NAD(P)-dependent dehydrogenase (short-subunit alcohol dehydrogenase family)
MTNLANSRVIVTGGSAGLGLAMVGALAERGADVTAIARDPTKLGAARDAGARTIVGDATDAALINIAVADVDPDVLILNAGARLPLVTIDQEDWDSFSSIWNTDVKATLVGIQAAPMRPGARVLIMSSGAAMVMSHPAIPRSLTIDAVKAEQRALSETATAEVIEGAVRGRHGLKVEREADGPPPE